MKHYRGATIVGVDPGETTGLFALFPDGRSVSYEMQFLPAVTFVNDLARKHLKERLTLLIATERFVISERTVKAGLEAYWSIEITGCMRWISLKYGMPLESFGVSDTKHFAADDVLKKLSWWHRGGDGHANDAARVTTLALAATDPSRWKRLVLSSGLLREERRE